MQGAVVVILVVEDDQLIQGMVEEALYEGGYEASISASGEEALLLLQQDRDKYRAIVTDINLSGSLTGWDVGRRARELSPEIPVIYMTGAAADQWTSQGVPHSILLNKPFAPAQLITAVSQLLNAGSSPLAPT